VRLSLIIVQRIFSFVFLLSTWNWGMAWVGLLPLIGSILIWTLPESPRWLVQERKQNEAAQSLRKLRQSNDIEAELVEIEEEEIAANKEDLGIGKVLSSNEFRWPLITSLVLNGVQQLSGINAVRNNSFCLYIKVFFKQVFFYSGDMFSLAGLREEKILWAILATGVINLIATLVALKLIELLGRRPLIIWPLAAIIAIMVCLTIFIVLNV
jgi:MFS family permease